MNFNMLKRIHDTLKRGIYSIQHKLRDVGIAQKRSPKWTMVEKQFLVLHTKCAVCGENKKLNVHHKLPFHLHPELELDPNNLMVLCMGKLSCHLKIGHAGNFKGYNPNVGRDADLLRSDISKFELVATQAKTYIKYE